MVALGVQHNALSVDHLEELSNSDIEALKNPKPCHCRAVLFLRHSLHPCTKTYRRGLPLALASDYNPGSAPSGNMNFVVSLTHQNENDTEEAIIAATVNGAYAMEFLSIMAVLLLEKKPTLF